MNKHIITSLKECSLTFNTIESAKAFANKHNLQVCQIYYLNEHTPILLGYGIENENEILLGTKDFTWV